MASAWGKSWGSSWGSAWGTIEFNPNAMRGSASFAFTAVATLTSGGVAPGNMAGTASFTFSAFGVLSDVNAIAIQQDTFNWQAASRQAMQGRYTADPVIARMAQRTRRKSRW